MTKAAKAVGLPLAAATVLVVLGACSGSSGSASSNKAAEQPTAAQRRAALAPAATTSADTAAGATSGPGANTNSQVRLIDSSAKIRMAWMTVDVRGAANVATRADAADAVVDSVGGEIDSDDRTGGKDAAATLRLRVPPSTLQGVLAKLSSLGVEKSRRSTTTDVTAQVADVASRVQSARTAIAQLRALFHRAGKVGDLLAVENELTTREANLEALEAQQRNLARQTSLATITLSLRTAPTRPAITTKHTDQRSGFVAALARGWHGFTAAAAWVASAFATLLPFLALLALIALGLRLFGVRVRFPRFHQS